MRERGCTEGLEGVVIITEVQRWKAGQGEGSVSLKAGR